MLGLLLSRVLTGGLENGVGTLLKVLGGLFHSHVRFESNPFNRAIEEALVGLDREHSAKQAATDFHGSLA